MIESSKPRFVVQAHSQPGRSTHYDLMLERDGWLATWSFASEPWKTDWETQRGDENSANVPRKTGRYWRMRRKDNVGARVAGTCEKESTAFELRCVELAPHRVRYLDYEGDIGGNRGSVRIVDKGIYSIQEWTEERVVVNLHGAFMRGEFELRLETASEC